MAKTESYKESMKDFVSLSKAQLLNKQIPAKIKAAKELIGLDEDSIIAILRHFTWNQTILEDQWFDKSADLRVKIGLDYDTNLN